MIFRKNDTDFIDGKLYRKARKRASWKETYELINWADTAGTDMAWNVNMYRKQRDAGYLHETRNALATLLAVIDELEHRHYTG